MQISVTILQFQGTNTSTHCPTCLRHALLELDRVTGQLQGCGGNVVRMLLE